MESKSRGFPESRLISAGQRVIRKHAPPHRVIRGGLGSCYAGRARAHATAALANFRIFDFYDGFLMFLMRELERSFLRIWFIYLSLHILLCYSWKEMPVYTQEINRVYIRRAFDNIELCRIIERKFMARKILLNPNFRNVY